MEIETHNCRFCGAPLTHTFVDLGKTPLANSYLRPQDIDKPEPVYPLHARVCSECLLVQVDDVVAAEDIFSDYAYFSSYSESWVRHASEYARDMVERFSLDRQSHVVEVASNDGYLLQHFVSRGVPVLGIEPAANVAEVAREKGVTTEVAFFNKDTAEHLKDNGHMADLIAANNVLAHVPDINAFVAGFPILLKPEGVLTVEFPHIFNLIEKSQFDTIYHEHYSYYSLLVVERLFAAHGLRVFDVEELPTHGGSLRVFACHADAKFEVQPDLQRLRDKEKAAGLSKLETYGGFESKVIEVKHALLEFLNKAKAEGKVVAAYGAAAKGNTLLNYCGVGSDLIAYVVDRNPVKQGNYLPGSRILIHGPEMIEQTKPDYVLILPWNLEREISRELNHISSWGGRFVVPIPSLQIREVGV